jgi:D-alanine-D-alanine ligase
MSPKTRVALIFGGQSAEHEISIRSARNVQIALQSAGFDVLLIGIDRAGLWRLAPQVQEPKQSWPLIFMPPGMGGKIVTHDSWMQSMQVDAVFPVLHGPCGEDGSIQGLLRLCQVPFVGCDVMSSALCMDKVMAKRVLNATGLPTADSTSITRKSEITFSSVASTLGKTVFVKPANMGSSIGVSRVDSEESFTQALDLAFEHDAEVLIEAEIVGRELECAVLSDDGLCASVPGEIMTTIDPFYSYEAKYLDENGTQLSYPADLPSAVTDEIRTLSIAAARALACEGLVRVDFFLKPDGALVINELNTMPGFTAISMYPKLWNASGRSNANIARTLVHDAFRRFADQANRLNDKQEQQKSTPA